MNRDCNGDFFTAQGKRMYRCLADGSLQSDMKNGDICWSCDRKIDAQDHGELPVVAVTLYEVTLPNGWKVLLSQEINK